MKWGIQGVERNLYRCIPRRNYSSRPYILVITRQWNEIILYHNEEQIQHKFQLRQHKTRREKRRRRQSSGVCQHVWPGNRKHVVHENKKPTDHIQSGNSESKIDYILTNKTHLKDIINCKTIPGEAVVSQHRLVVVDLRTSTKKKRQYQRENEVKIN